MLPLTKMPRAESNIFTDGAKLIPEQSPFAAMQKVLPRYLGHFVLEEAVEAASSIETEVVEAVLLFGLHWPWYSL